MIINSFRIYALISLSLICRALREGNVCKTKDGRSSVCKRTENCPKTVNDMRYGIYPQVCGFNGSKVIVCCPPEQLERSVADSDDDEDGIHFSYSAPRKKSKVQEGFTSKEPDDDYDDDRIRFVYNRSPIKSKAAQACDRYVKQKCPPTLYKLPPLRVLVVGGRNANSKEYPHMALIGYGEKTNVRWLCGGSLISQKFVLSAAHCVSSPSAGPAHWVRLGELDYESTTDDSQPTDYQIINRIVHPGYRSTSVYHDIALFELDRNVIFNAYIYPTCLQTDSNVSSILIATGWGQTGIADPVSSWLQTVQLSLISAQTCSDIYGRSDKFDRGIDSATMICAGELSGGKDTCTGDSGGPLQKKLDSCQGMYVQIGITSFGRGCAFSDNPGVYTKISHYIRWIESVVWK